VESPEINQQFPSLVFRFILKTAAAVQGGNIHWYDILLGLGDKGLAGCY